jgi:DUF4097 and DUF4098 domain-containing protein YvlB
MQQLIRITAALALIAASFPVLAERATATRAWQFKPESVAGLKVRNLIGDVRVEGGTDPGFHVTAQVTIDADSTAEAERLLGLIDFRTSDVGAGSRFDVRFPREHFPKIYWEGGSPGWWSISYVEYLDERIRLTADRGEAPAIKVNLVIRAPAGSKLDVKNWFGNATANAVDGELRLDGSSGLLRSSAGVGRLELDNGSGEVEVAGHRGQVGADTGSGSVKISDCECEITADVGSGSVNVHGGAGALRADTGSGRVRVEGFSGSIAADTGSGSVHASAVRNVRNLDVDTGSGSVTVEGDLSALESLNIDTGSGGVSLRSTVLPSIDIRIDTGSGGVDVDAPGATVKEADGVWSVRTREGTGRGNIDTGSGSVDISMP